MKFIDSVNITVEAGQGGEGALSFQRLPGRPNGPANGGDGGPLGFTPWDYHDECGEEGPSIRDYNYRDKTDEFFQEVCALMGWSW